MTEVDLDIALQRLTRLEPATGLPVDMYERRASDSNTVTGKD